MKRILYILSLTIVVAACQKDYSIPALPGDPGIVANTTIADLKALYTTPGDVVTINDSLVISGIVNMDDRSGNYYQQISIQDETGGIILRLSGSNHNTLLPVGRRVYVKCKGLYLGDYRRTMQLGGGADTINGGITLLASNLIDKHIIRGAINQTIVPKQVNISQLGTDYQDPYVNTLIQLTNVEFIAADTSKTYSDKNASSSRILEACTNPVTNRIAVRTSNFANFALLPIPNGNGRVTGIYTVFGTTKQLTLRDTNDVKLNEPRCSAGGSPGPVANVITLGASPYVINFDSLQFGLPLGVTVSMNGNTSSIGTPGTFTPAKASWSNVNGGFKNFASATGLFASATTAQQDASTNRALGVRQTSAPNTGGDPGASLLFTLANTLNRTNFALQFRLQSVDVSSNRTTIWNVDYALGDNPVNFTNVSTGTLSTGTLTFTDNLITTNLPAVLNNNPQKVWIRIITKTPTFGGGNRASSAIDDVRFNWN